MSLVLAIELGGKEYDRAEAALEELARTVFKVPETAAKDIGHALRETLQRVAKAVIERNSTPWSAGRSGSSLYRRSGGISSIAGTVRVSGEGGDLQGSISTGSIGGIHETGGTVRARSKFLTIPLPAALDARGVSLKRFSRDWDKTFVARSKRGNLIIFRRDLGKTTPLYVLKPSVYIRPRLGMEAALMGELPFFETRALDAIADRFTMEALT